MYMVCSPSAAFIVVGWFSIDLDCENFGQCNVKCNMFDCKLFVALVVYGYFFVFD
jgi:hypothetical protein